jgi:hypothetical protein
MKKLLEAVFSVRSEQMLHCEELRLREFHPVDKANAIVLCLGSQFTPHDLCDENHERRVEARVEVVL